MESDDALEPKPGRRPSSLSEDELASEHGVFPIPRVDPQELPFWRAATRWTSATNVRPSRRQATFCFEETIPPSIGQPRNSSVLI